MKNTYTVLIVFILFAVALVAQVAAPSTPQIIGVKYEGFDGIDRATNALYTIDYAHHEIHAGSHFYFFDHNEIASGASVTYLIQTPDSAVYSHMLFAVDGLGVTEFEMYINTDRDGVATGTAFNSNHNSSKTSTLKIYKGVASGTTDGTLIYRHKSGSATNQARSHAVGGREDELILKRNTKYLFRTTSGSAANLTNAHAAWYEHTDKN